MRILFYLHQFPAFGGIETVTATLARQFAKDGHAVRIVSMQARDGTALLGQLPPDSWRLLPSEQIDADANRAALRDELRTFNPDVILFQDSYAPIENLLFAAVKEADCRAPVIVCEHNSPLYWRHGQPQRPWTLRGVAFRLCKPAFYAREYLRQRRRRLNLLAHVSRYVVLAQAYVPQMRLLVGKAPLSRVSAICNPVSAVGDLGRLELERKENTVLFVGSLIPRKGVRRIIDCWAKLEGSHPSWRLEIVGDGPQRAELERRAAELGLRNAAFAGHQADTESRYRRASILAVASDFEGWPMVIGEAMKAGCVPVVYDSFAAVPEMFEDGVSGCAVRHYAEERFARMLASLMDNPEKLRRMQKNAAEFVRRFQVAETSRRWYAFFADALGAGRVGRSENPPDGLTA